MKLSAVRKFFVSKLQMSKEEAPTHEHFVPTLNGSGVNLPVVLALSRGNGEIKMNNLKGIAVALGLSLEELKNSVMCRVSARVCFYSASASTVRRVFLLLSPKEIRFI